MSKLPSAAANEPTSLASEETSEARSLATDTGLAPMERAVRIMRLLRSPAGCPWDREQSFDTIKRHTLEEVYEVFDAIERRAWADLRDELGDLLLQVLFYAQMAEEAGFFNIGEVAAGLNAKLVRRHPHVFGEVLANDAAAVVRNWDAIKLEEKKDAGADPRGVLEDVPRNMPAMLEAAKLGSRAGKVGFDWPDAEGLLHKMREELDEVAAEMKPNAEGHSVSSPSEALEEEIGDLLFTAVNLARHLQVDAEGVLRSANAKFRRRFGEMEKDAGTPEAMRQFGAEEWDARWRAVKAEEASR